MKLKFDTNMTDKTELADKFARELKRRKLVDAFTQGRKQLDVYDYKAKTNERLGL